MVDGGEGTDIILWTLLPSNIGLTEASSAWRVSPFYRMNDIAVEPRAVRPVATTSHVVLRGGTCTARIGSKLVHR
jgi:hypothetical protein